MSKQLQKLIVTLEAESSKLQSQLEKSNKKLDRWEKKAGKSVDKVKRVFIGLASVASVAIFAKITKDAIEFADSIGKVSDAVGLATDTYQGYVHAASLAGIEQSQLNSNLTAFVKRVGEAREGVGPLISFMNKYDETLLKNIKNSKNQEEAFGLVADAIQNATTATDKAAIANAAFSRAGVAMTLMMKNGAAGLREMKREAYDLGIILDEQTIRKAEEANDKLDIMARVIKTKLVKELVKLSPTIIKVGNAFTDAIPKVTKFFDRLFDKTSVAALESDLEKLTNKAGDLSETLAHHARNPIGGLSVIASFFGVDTNEELQAQLDTMTAKIGDTVTKINEKRKEMATQQAAIELGLKGTTSGGRGTGEAAQAELDAAQEQAAKKFIILDESLLAENERLMLAYENRQFIIEDAFQNEIISSMKRDEILEQLKEKHNKQIEKLDQKSMTAQERAWQLSWKGKLRVMGGVLGSISLLMQSENKKQFEIGKKAAIAQTVINTYEMATSSYKALAGIPIVGPVLGAIAAGAAILYGKSQISAIKSQQFGGGGVAGGGAPSIPTTASNASTGLPEGSPGDVGPDQEPQKVVNISISGNPTGEQVRDLIEAINEEQGNGAVLRATVAA